MQILWWDSFIGKVEEFGNPESAAKFVRVPAHQMNTLLNAYPEKRMEIRVALRRYRENAKSRVLAGMDSGLSYATACQRYGINLDDASTWLREFPEVRRKIKADELAMELGIPVDIEPLVAAEQVGADDPDAVTAFVSWWPRKHTVERVTVHKTACAHAPARGVARGTLFKAWTVRRATLARFLGETKIADGKIFTGCQMCGGMAPRVVVETAAAPVIRYRIKYTNLHDAPAWREFTDEARAMEFARDNGVDTYTRAETYPVPPEGYQRRDRLPVIHMHDKEGEISPELFWTSYGWLPVELHILRPHGGYTVATIDRDGPTIQEEREACGCP